MDRKNIEAVFRALNDSGARYLVVGGLAVIAHGFLRVTKDLDLVLDFEPANVLKAVEALESLGFQPLVPVPFRAFADAENRRSWREDKNARVFQIWSDRFPTVRIDLFLDSPFDFGPAWQGAIRNEILPGLVVPFVGLEILLAMKREAGRPQDHIDIAQLERLRDWKAPRPPG
jgi:predicted nucleotidyltransferase